MGKTESFEFVNELALAFRSGEKHARPQYAPVLEGIRAVLTHLTTAGRLIPAGGRGLEFSEVEALRSAWEELKGYRVDGYARPYVNQMVKAVGALFPATEPAEVISRYQTMQRGFAAKHFGFPANPVFEDRYTAPDGGKWQWTDELQWELRCYPPAPAEPAEEETKAEVHDPDSWCTGTHGRAGNCIDTSRWIDPPIATAETHMEKMVRKGSIAKFLERTLVAGDGWHLPTGWDPGVLAGAIVYGVPASSPVVPTPTETGAGHA